MMKNKLFSMVLSVFLLLILFLICFLNASELYLGPYFKNYSSEMEVYENMMKKLNVQDSEYLGCYKLNEKVYIAEINKNSNKTIIWFDEDGSVLAERKASDYNLNRVISVQQELDMENSDCSLGWYHNQPVFVLKDENKEALINFDNLEVILVYKKDVVN